MGAVAEGVYGRSNCRQWIERNDRVQVALLHVSTICLSLYAGFWVQYLCQMLYGMPSLYVLSGGRWFPPYVGYYLPCGSGLPCSLADGFMLLSLSGSLLALGSGWWFTRGARGKWRMRGAIAFFALMLSGWSVAGRLGEASAWAYLEDQKRQLIREIDQADADPDYLEARLRWVDEQLELKPLSRMARD